MGAKQSTPPRSRACSNTGEMPVMANGSQGPSDTDQSRVRTHSLGSFMPSSSASISNPTQVRGQNESTNRDHAEPMIARAYPVYPRRQFAAQSLPAQLFSFHGDFVIHFFFVTL